MFVSKKKLHKLSSTVYNNLGEKICTHSPRDRFLIGHLANSFLIWMSWISDNISWPHFCYLCTLSSAVFIQCCLQEWEMLGSWLGQQTARVTKWTQISCVLFACMKAREVAVTAYEHMELNNGCHCWKEINRKENKRKKGKNLKGFLSFSLPIALTHSCSSWVQQAVSALYPILLLFSFLLFSFLLFSFHFCLQKQPGFFFWCCKVHFCLHNWENLSHVFLSYLFTCRNKLCMSDSIWPSFNFLLFYIYIL